MTSVSPPDQDKGVFSKARGWRGVGEGRGPRRTDDEALHVRVEANPEVLQRHGQHVPIVEPERQGARRLGEDGTMHGKGEPGVNCEG